MQTPTKRQALLWSVAVLMSINFICAIIFAAGGRTNDGILIFAIGCAVAGCLGSLIATFYRSPED